MAMLKTADRKGLTLSRRTKPTVITPFTPTMPDVNLLPPRVFETFQAKKARHKLAMGGAILAVVVAGAFLTQAAQIKAATDAFDTETAKTAGLEKQVKALTPVKVYYAGVAAQKLTVQKTMARELHYSQVVTELVKNSTPGLKIETITVGIDAAGSSSASSVCPPPNPFQPAAMVTCVQFTGTATGREDVSGFLVNLIGSNKFANVYVPVTDSGDGKAITFNGSVGITEQFFSNRYADDKWLFQGAGVEK